MRLLPQLAVLIVLFSVVYAQDPCQTGIEGTLFPGSTDDPDEYSPLCQFYYATGGPTSWKNRSNWMTPGTSYCTWYGVTCSSNATANIYDPNNGMTGNLVVKLALSDNGLVGSIPESLGQLRGLQELWLDHNGLYGSIPNSIGEAWMLVIVHLEVNSLTGAIPQGVGQMRFLQQFFFDHNHISGNIPDSMSGMRHLLFLDGSHNDLAGNIPYTFQFMGNLTYLDFSFNQLQGRVPSYLNNLPYLRVLRLSNNKLTAVDSSLVQAGIVSCDLSVNPFLCPLPSWTSLCAAMCA